VVRVGDCGLGGVMLPKKSLRFRKWVGGFRTEFGVNVMSWGSEFVNGILFMGGMKKSHPKGGFFRKSIYDAIGQANALQTEAYASTSAICIFCL
jgi:hypothetical protein